MKKQVIVLVLTAAILVTSAIAQQLTLPLAGQDFTTLDGDKYTNATVRRIEPDGIVVADTDGIRKLKFKNLPAEIGTKYGYDPAKAASFQATAQAAAIASQNQVAQMQAAQTTAIQQAGEREERFATWTAKLTKLRDYANNVRNPDPFKSNESVREGPEREANAFEARFTALRQLIAILDQAGVSSETTKHLIDEVYERKVFIGMPAEFVTLSWGQPTKVNSITGEQGSSEQWVYRRGDVEADYVNVDNGVVTSVQN